EKTVFRTDFVTPERITFVGSRCTVWITERRERLVTGLEVIERRGHATNAVPFGGAQIQKVVVIELKIDAELRIDDRLPFRAREGSRLRPVQRPIEINAVFVSLAGDACARDQADVLYELPGDLPISSQLLITQGFLLINRLVPGQQRLPKH